MIWDYASFGMNNHHEAAINSAQMIDALSIVILLNGKAD